MIKHLVMTREQIEKEARGYIRDVYAGDGYFLPDYEEEVRDAFISGARWCIDSVWHDASEKPENGRYILVDKGYRFQEVWKQDICDDWLNDVNYFGVKRWAYVGDLLPERKEETE